MIRVIWVVVFSILFVYIRRYCNYVVSRSSNPEGTSATMTPYVSQWAWIVRSSSKPLRFYHLETVVTLRIEIASITFSVFFLVFLFDQTYSSNSSFPDRADRLAIILRRLCSYSHRLTYRWRQREREYTSLKVC
jgi:hypothetical protein